MKTHCRTIKFSLFFTAIAITACSNILPIKAKVAEQPSNEMRHKSNVRVEAQTAKKYNGSRPVRACTLIGCFNSIVVTLPENLASAPGLYEMEVGLNNDAIRHYRIIVPNTDTSANTCQHAILKKFNIDGHDSISINLNSEACQKNKLNRLTHIRKFTGFNIFRANNAASLAINIKNPNGKYILQKSIDLTKIITKKIEPNGPGCGGCKKQIVDFR